MSEGTDQERRRFVGAAVMALAAAQVRQSGLG
jgi:hypothetical protein